MRLFGYGDLRGSLKWSVGLHLSFMVFAMIGLPNLAEKPLVTPKNIVVDLVAPSELTAAPNSTKEKKQPKPPEKKPEKKVEDKPKPAPKSEPKKIDQAVLKKEKPVEKVKPEPVPPKETVKKKKAEKKIEKKKEPPKETKPAEPEQFSSLLKNLVGEEETPKPTPKTPAVDAPLDPTKDSGVASVISDNLTLSQADALRYQLSQCWSVPVGAMDAENLTVEILATVGPDRVVRTTDIVDKARYNRDPFFRTAAESARRALLNPRCSPLALPEDKYDLWKTMRIRFNPQEMFGG